ncbi:MAG: peptide ABC transporter substrate-binding protein [Anaerolineae bacterium]|nr:peptide ABC transporter substrate-binding protein [Anaerolineae bacterium]
MQNTKLAKIIRLTSLGLIFLFISACTPDSTPTAEVTLSPTSTSTPTPIPTPTATPLPPEKEITICMQEEPESLYLYAYATTAARYVQEAIYDGPIDRRGYDYQPVILEELPSIKNQGITVQTTTVKIGDAVIDANGERTQLEEGVLVLPAGCQTRNCAARFTGETVEMDQQVVTFRIKEGILWADGEPVTAEDSVYSFELAAHIDTPGGPKYLIRRTGSYKALDSQTVVWTGLPGYADRMSFMNFFTPLPRHLWETELDYAPPDLLKAEASSRTPLGWGAYVIKDWVPGAYIALEKNPFYFRAAEDLPYVDIVTFRFVSDPSMAVAELVSGNCDIVTEDIALDSQIELLLKLEEQGLAIPLFTPGELWEHIDFGITPNEDYTRPDFFEDVRVRQAVAYCLNRQAIVDTYLYGQVPVLDSYIPPTHPLYAGAAITLYPYDPEKGQALLEEAGWQDKNGDGVREAYEIEGIVDTVPLAFEWGFSCNFEELEIQSGEELTPTEPIRTEKQPPPLCLQYVEQLQQDLARCGMDVSLKNYPAQQWFEAGKEGILFGRQFDIGSFAWLNTLEPPCTLYTSSEIPAAGNNWTGQNATGYSNRTYDEVCRLASAAWWGTEAYIESHKEAQRILAKELPMIPLFQHLKITALRPNISGVVMDSTDNVLWNIEAFDKAVND